MSGFKAGDRVRHMWTRRLGTALLDDAFAVQWGETPTSPPMATNADPTYLEHVEEA